MTRQDQIERKKQYGPQYQDHLLEQYKLYIESIDKVSDRRQGANSYFIIVNTTLVSLMGFSSQDTFIEFASWGKPLIAGLGMMVCIIFWFLIRSYKQLNTGKFALLHEIEKELPIELYRREWEILKEGKKLSVYFPFSHIEQTIPPIFGLFYLILLFAFLPCQ